MTDFTSIYDKFLSKIEDYGYAALSEEDANAHFNTYLVSATSQFEYMCSADLSKKTETAFIEPLSEMEQEILALWMVIYHVDNKKITEDNMRNFLNSKDYKQYSSANLLKVLNDTSDKLKSDVHSLMSLYDNMNMYSEWRERNGK